MSSPARFSRRARNEFLEVLAYQAQSQQAARRLQHAVAEAARLIGDHPEIGNRRLSLLDHRYRFWSVRGFPYLIVYRPAAVPPLILRFVHAARDLPRVLSDLADVTGE